MADILRGDGYVEVTVHQDLQGIERVVEARRAPEVEPEPESEGETELEEQTEEDKLLANDEDFA